MITTISRSCALWWSLSLLAFTIVIGAHIHFGFHTYTQRSHEPIEALIPKDLPGWHFEAIKLGDTPHAVARTENILKCTDTYSCRYNFGRHHLAFYASYWAPGVASPREVGSHTPDICWILNGWTSAKCPDFKPMYSQGQLLKLYENRLYMRGGISEHVIFWHLIEGQSYYLRGMPLGDGHRLWRDIKTYGLNQHREQYFIRLSSDLPWEALWDNGNFQKLLRSLSPLGIFEQPMPDPAIR